LLSLLAEQPMHGYKANLELERHNIHDWAGISRPQVYYSLGKLARLGLISAADAPEPPGRPRTSRVYNHRKGSRRPCRRAGEQRVAAQRDRPPFLTWVALCWQARPGVFEKQLQHRKRFLEEELTREQATLRGIRKEVGHRYHEAVWMARLMILQFRTELRCLQELSAEMHHRARSTSQAVRLGSE
jgi:hypothetical protein